MYISTQCVSLFLVLLPLFLELEAQVPFVNSASLGNVPVGIYTRTGSGGREDITSIANANMGIYRRRDFPAFPLPISIDPPRYIRPRYPVRTYPAAKPVSTYPAAKPVSTYPAAKPVSTYPKNPVKKSYKPSGISGRSGGLLGGVLGGSGGLLGGLLG